MNSFASDTSLCLLVYLLASLEFTDWADLQLPLPPVTAISSGTWANISDHQLYCQQQASSLPMIHGQEKQTLCLQAGQHLERPVNLVTPSEPFLTSDQSKANLYSALLLGLAPLCHTPFHPFARAILFGLSPQFHSTQHTSFSKSFLPVLKLDLSKDRTCPSHPVLRWKVPGFVLHLSCSHLRKGKFYM